LKQTKEGSYTTQLPWKLDHPALQENQDLAEARLRTTTTWLREDWETGRVSSDYATAARSKRLFLSCSYGTICATPTCNQR
jgi:hypothetical protein